MGACLDRQTIEYIYKFDLDHNGFSEDELRAITPRIDTESGGRFEDQNSLMMDAVNIALSDFYNLATEAQTQNENPEQRPAGMSKSRANSTELRIPLYFFENISTACIENLPPLVDHINFEKTLPLSWRAQWNSTTRVMDIVPNNLDSVAFKFSLTFNGVTNLNGGYLDGIHAKVTVRNKDGSFYFSQILDKPNYDYKSGETVTLTFSKDLRIAKLEQGFTVEIECFKNDDNVTTVLAKETGTYGPAHAFNLHSKWESASYSYNIDPNLKQWELVEN